MNGFVELRSSSPARLGLALGAILVAQLAAPCAARALPRGADGRALIEAANAVSELRLEDATLLDELATRHPNDPDVHFERAMWRFAKGDYAGAVQDATLGIRPDAELRSLAERLELYRILVATQEATRGFLEVRSADGRYIVRHAPGPDRVLADYALEALEAADRALESELGYRVPGPVRLEIYPTAATLALVSSLTVEEIETTGTIALCKWDRLMITSPRALVRGYPWVDTIGHEFVHLVLSRAAHDRAPVWMQEGFARFLERRWRGGAPSVLLDSPSNALLSAAVREHRLLPFDRLHPSIAMLPSAEEAALAFAQVSTFVERFYRDHGPAALRDVIARVSAGVDARDAFAAASGETWDALENQWKLGLARRQPAEGEAEVRPLVFRHDGQEHDDTREVRVDEARRFVRLGDLLWSRQRPLGASVEYGKAWDRANGDPIVASRLARSALAGGRAERAIEVLEPLVETIRDHEPLWAVLASARLSRGDLDAAETAALEAIRLNPFDPQPHCDLAQAASQYRERESRICRELGAH